MYYVYLLQDKNNHVYIGYSTNLKQRIARHKSGNVKSTSHLTYPKLIYYETYSVKQLAITREKRLKQFGSSYTGLLKRLGLK